MNRSVATLFTLGLMVSLVSPLPLAAEEAAPQPACPSTPVALPPDLASWQTPVSIGAAGAPAALAVAELKLGTAVTATMAPTPSVTYVHQPAKPGGSVSFGGMLSITIPADGTYRIALSNRSWIDLLEGDAVIDSIGHKPGPDCSGMRKTVDFPLKAGPHVIQLGAGDTPTVTVLVTKVP
ncbi:hypothetical protein [Oryzibacter oryziterrae]|uniref:hypothetical protein n=1 Tax=Oryzibacter oryziterrae TaxID=2766474 RepID=UPI001F1E0706|nr:hypothetical protein [Oryzibacter oryziterrae]